MFDWQVNEQEEALPNKSPEERPPRRMRGWYLLGGLLLLLIMAGLFLFRWRLSERTELMQDDLRAFIRHEEQQRAFGLTEEADKLMVSNAPQEWQQAYRSTFVTEPDEVQQVELEVEEIQLKGTSAYVTVRLDEVAQERFYRLVGQEWRRAPLSEQFWGEERQIELADEGITIIYRAHDEAFVERLVAELPTLLEQWSAKKRPATIRIEPTEFAPALLYVSQSDSTPQIALNSPNLVMRGEVHGEAAIRLALADALLEEANLDYETKPRLPGATTFLAAIRTTFILRWALPDEAIPRQIWHEKAKRRGKSPILGKWHINREEALLARAWQPRLSQATLLLMADYLYDQYGSEGLGSVMKQLPTAESWDRIFYPLTGYYTIELEEKVRFADSEAKTGTPPAPKLPLHVTVLDIDAETGVLKVQLADRNEPLSIQAIGGTLVDPEGITYTAHCAGLYKELTISEGDWLAVGQELQARQLVVSESSPSISLPAESTLAPPDTFAYLAERRLGESGGFTTFMALSEDGTITHLTTLPPSISSGWHLQSKIPWPPRFLLTLNVPNCGQAWLLMYDPQQGIVERWLTTYSDSYTFTGINYAWRLLEEHFILTGPILVENRHNSDGYTLFWSAAAGKPLHLLGELSESLYLLGWSGGKAITFDGLRNYVSLIDLTSGRLSKSIYFADESPSLFMLSENGTRLFYSGQSALAPPTFNMLDIEKSQKNHLFSLLDGEWIRPMAGGTSTDHLLLWRELKTSDTRIARDLRLVDLDALDEPTIVMEISPDEYVMNALLCADDRVLMIIYDGQQSEVRMWQPDGSISTLLKTDKRLDLLSCR